MRKETFEEIMKIVENKQWRITTDIAEGLGINGVSYQLYPMYRDLDDSTITCSYKSYENFIEISRLIYYKRSGKKMSSHIFIEFDRIVSITCL